MQAADGDDRHERSWSSARQVVAHLRRQQQHRGRGAVYNVHEPHCPPGPDCECRPRLVIVRPRRAR